MTLQTEVQADSDKQEEEEDDEDEEGAVGGNAGDHSYAEDDELGKGGFKFVNILCQFFIVCKLFCKFFC